MSKPHVHAATIKAWADGAEVQFFGTGAQAWLNTSAPLWNPNFRYRIKPKPPIKKWKWVVQTGPTSYDVSAGHYTSPEEYSAKANVAIDWGWKAIQKIDSTEIEVAQ